MRSDDINTPGVQASAPTANERERAFFAFVIECGVLRFGEFTLKSGRVSPYFFNAGLFNTGARLARLAEFYAHAIVAANIAYDMVFGPAYKGIPLATATASALARLTGNDVPFAFDRKEAKDHGEGGLLVGSPLAGRVLIIDDVISAGTSVAHSLRLIEAAGAHAIGVAIALDRQERGNDTRSATQELAQRGLRTISIATIAGLEAYLQAQGAQAQLTRIQAYRAQYGAMP